MKTFSVRTRLTLLALVVFGAGLVAVIEFTEWSKLHAVTLNNEEVEDWPEEWGLDKNKSVLEQPTEEIARALLDQRSVVKVEVAYDLPGAMHIVTNRFDPVSFVLDRSSGRMWGLNETGRAVPLPVDQKNWEHPVLTSVDTRGLFQPCDDPRVAILMPQMAHLREANLDLYRLIDEIDLGSSQYVVVTLSGLSYRLKVAPEKLAAQLANFVRFVEKYQPDTEDTRVLDLRYDNLIIQVAQGK